MGHFCSKGVSGNTVKDRGIRGSATPNNHRLPNATASLPSFPLPPPPPQPAGDVTAETHSSQSSTPAHPLATSPWQSMYPPGIAPPLSPASRTPRRKSKWPFPPPSLTKPIMSSLMRRLQGATAASSSSQPPNERPIPRENHGGGDAGQRALNKRFGYANNFASMFEVGRKLGRGHFGLTCMAKGLMGVLKNQTVAVKIISKAQMTTASSIEDVRREVRILNGLSGHQNMVQFHDVFEDDNNVYIVMELCEGGELLDWIETRNGRFKEEDAKKILVQLLNGVAYMHLQGVVHRDLKPENFLFAKRGSYVPMKVIDFGLSDFIKPDQRLSDVVGSAFYIAPEVLHRSYDTNADMWSIGVIAYILLCGCRPFWGHSESSIFRCVIEMEPNIQDGPWRSTISAHAKDFVRRLLVKDHRKRMTASQALTHPWLRTENPSVPLDIFIFKSVKYYTHASTLRRAALKALAKTLTEKELVYLRAQFQLLEPTDDDFICFDNFKGALMKNMSEIMKESGVTDILCLMKPLSPEKMEFEEFCAAAISPIQLETLDNWEQMVRTAYYHFDQQENRKISVHEIAEEENLRPIPSIVRQWVRSDGKLSFLGYTKILHGTSVHGPVARLRRPRKGGIATPVPVPVPVPLPSPLPRRA